MLRTFPCIVLASLVLMLAPHAGAQCLPAVCSVTITFRSDASGISLSGSGSNAAGMSFGTASAFGGTVPSGVTKITGATNWTLSTPFDVEVDCTNLLTLLPCTLLLTPTFTLTAQLQSADATDTWKLNSQTLTNSGATTLTAAGTYGQNVAYTFALTIPFSKPAGSISNMINFVAISN